MLAVYLDGKLVREVPSHIKADRARVIVAEAVAELKVAGVVELRDFVQEPKPKPVVTRRRRSVNDLPRIIG